MFTAELLIVFALFYTAHAHCPRIEDRHIGDLCFHISDRRLNFTDAQKYCRKESGNLAVIHNLLQNNFLASWVRTQTLTSVGAFWIGLSRPSLAANFQWDDGTTLHWSNFDQYFPQNKLFVAESTINGKWRSIYGETPLFFVCSYDPNFFVSTTTLVPSTTSTHGTTTGNAFSSTEKSPTSESITSQKTASTPADADSTTTPNTPSTSPAEPTTVDSTTELSSTTEKSASEGSTAQQPVPSTTEQATGRTQTLPDQPSTDASTSTEPSATETTTQGASSQSTEDHPSSESEATLSSFSTSTPKTTTRESFTESPSEEPAEATTTEDVSSKSPAEPTTEASVSSTFVTEKQITSNPSESTTEKFFTESSSTPKQPEAPTTELTDAPTSTPEVPSQSTETTERATSTELPPQSSSTTDDSDSPTSPASTPSDEQIQSSTTTSEVLSTTRLETEEPLSTHSIQTTEHELESTEASTVQLETETIGFSSTEPTVSPSITDFPSSESHSSTVTSTSTQPTFPRTGTTAQFKPNITCLFMFDSQSSGNSKTALATYQTYFNFAVRIAGRLASESEFAGYIDNFGYGPPQSHLYYPSYDLDTFDTLPFTVADDYEKIDLDLKEVDALLNEAVWVYPVYDHTCLVLISAAEEREFAGTEIKSSYKSFGTVVGALVGKATSIPGLNNVVNTSRRTSSDADAVVDLLLKQLH